jgi:hypothetical protein
MKQIDITTLTDQELEQVRANIATQLVDLELRKFQATQGLMAVVALQTQRTQYMQPSEHTIPRDVGLTLPKLNKVV